MTADSQTTARERLAWMFDAIQQAVIVTDTAGRVTFWNHYAERLYGWSAEEMLGRPIIEITPTPQSTQRAAEIMVFLSRGDTWSGEQDVRHRDGTEFVASVTLVPLFDANDQPAGVFAMSQLRTSVGDAESRARTSGELLASAFRASRDLVVLFRWADETILDVNEAWLEVTGYRREDVIGRRQSDLNVWATPAEDDRFREQMEKTGTVRDFPVAFTRTSGAQGVALVSAEKISIGGEAFVIAIARDVTADLDAQERLRASEEGYRSLFENAIDAVILCTPEGEILEANRAAIGLFGWSEAELRKHGTDLLLPRTSPDYKRAMRELARNNRFRGKQILHRQDGTTFVGDVSVGRFRDRSGAARSTVIVRDITEEAGAETKFRTLLEHAVVGVHIVKDARFIYCNPGGQRILGYSEEELIALPSMFELVVEEEREHVIHLVKEWLAAPIQPLAYCARVRRGDGAIIEIAVQATLIEYDGSPVVLGTCIDITEQQQAAEELQKSENRYRTLVEEAQDIIFSCDVDGKITSLNHAFEQITGWKREEWLGRSYEELLEPESLGPAQEHFQSILHDAGVGHRESRLRTARGTPILIEGTARALHVDGKIVGTLGIVRDISERRRMEVALERSARFTALGRLAATIAHEFNNVLMGVQATVDLMRRSKDPATLTRGLESLRTSIARGRRMTQEVLQFTRMPEPDTEPFRLVPMIESMLHELENLAGARIRVALRLQAPSEATVAGDRAQIQQVITNLIINARDAMPDGGQITIGVTEGPPARNAALGTLVITVADTGVGISPEMVGLIFEPLFTTKKSGGTGLGLAIVTQIVEKHHGTIDVESTPGSGTTFRITLPLCRRDETESATPAPRRLGTIERLLIVDDEPMITDGLSAVLELEGIATDVAALGRDAEAAVERFAPEIVLLDLNLPDISGAEVYDILTKRWPDLPIIISSGHVDESLVRELTHGARASFLAKPYDMETLLEALAAAAAPR
jgi:PAS domain S-box-containing protein